MKTRLKVLGAGVLAIALTGCVTQSREYWHNFESNKIVSEVGENDAALVFFRDNSGSETAAVNININGEYLTSLQQNGFSQVTTCAMPQRIGAFVTGTDNEYLRKENQGSFYKLPNGEVSYFRVTVGEDGQAVVTPVEAETALAEINTRKFQTNTLPRVEKKNTCVDRTQPRTYTLDASALFHFDKSGANNVLPKGQREIQEVARDIREYPVRIRAIEVIGHTDPQGSAAYNQRLSADRAQTVGNMLVQLGVPANLIQTRGLGESQPVVNGCAEQHKGNREALNACNQPNRRVEIKLYAQQ
ncbi:OmpA family protein [Neisseria animalis]|uniref:OmpA family protein n=1 Tax=Neisseria animalis TaxID=492 RepID=A0A5P3MP11_NEIAN|nr:OmpA family protein [Neisseria animalis]QEY23287.1 OmpA family protein [Neisseria animalis]ROW31959.1 OmpA family protein [Neisseria animalis]VEE08590.1 ompA family protein [Neisseria animalis]